MALSGNSNDWSGVYALVEILHTGSLIPGAPNLSAQDTEIPVSRVYREDVQGIVTYRIQPEKITVKCGDAETENHQRKGDGRYGKAPDLERRH